MKVKTTWNLFTQRCQVLSIPPDLFVCVCLRVCVHTDIYEVYTFFHK